MFCTHCGRDIEQRDQFCPSCGVPVKDIPLMPVESRIAGHLRLLGILWLALSAFRLVPGLTLAIMVENGMFRGEHTPPFLSPLLGGVAAAFLIAAAAGLVAGWGLLSKQPWARMVTIVLGSVNLVDIPLGTALGIYTFWVLLPVESEQHYQRLTRTQPA